MFDRCLNFKVLYWRLLLSLLPTLFLMGYLSAFNAIEKDSEVSLEFKVGQMLMVGFRGLEVNDQHPIIRDIRELHLGGVILFDEDLADQKALRNIQSPAQVSVLTAALQRAATVPLLIAVDHEGGVITRLKESYGFLPTVSHQDLGTLDNGVTTYREAKKMAKTLAAIGVNLNLAPVLDLKVNPDNPIIAHRKRSFSKDPRVVTRHALAFIRAHRNQGVLCTPKHFPGHGSSTEDSHIGFVDVTATWSRTELEPYVELIKAEQVDAIMTAHVFNAHLDTDYPATLSQATIEGLLRNQLNYKGVVISDDLQMKAITEHYGFETAVRKALEAGVDILLIANNLNYDYDETVARHTSNLVQRLVTEGVISEDHIDKSYQRIQKLKSHLLIPF